MKIDPYDWRIWAVAGAAAAIAATVTVFQGMGKPIDPDDTERRRRSHLNRVGRIVEGHIVELVEAAPPPAPPRGFGRRKGPEISNAQRKLICYSYLISGVSYETAQDVTTLEERAGLALLAAGQPASVKYDPSNPSNSILIADDWSGLR